MEKIREPIVADMFYPGSQQRLLEMLEKFMPGARESVKKKCIGVICPHAGYEYSGKTAGLTYSRVNIPETVILLGPNHTGYGEPYAVSNHEGWKTPLGTAGIDQATATALIKHSNYLEWDSVAHLREHSLEVQVPFLQFLNPEVNIVPITLSGHVSNPAWIEIGETIAQAVSAMGKNILLVASSDMTHYEPQQETEEKDRYVIEAIQRMDEQAVIDRIVEKNISMCGYGPVVCVIVAARQLGATSIELAGYETSGKTSKIYSQVVGYAGLTIS